MLSSICWATICFSKLLPRMSTVWVQIPFPKVPHLPAQLLLVPLESLVHTHLVKAVYDGGDEYVWNFTPVQTEILLLVCMPRVQPVHIPQVFLRRYLLQLWAEAWTSGCRTATAHWRGITWLGSGLTSSGLLLQMFPSFTWTGHFQTQMGTTLQL